MIFVCRIRRVPVSVHWTVPTVCAFFLGLELHSLLFVSVALASYLGVLLLHECGHLIAAQRRHYRVTAIELFPLHGHCRYDGPEGGFDGAHIAAGGVVAQFLVAVPCAVFVFAFGYTRFELLNVALAIFAFFNPVIALLNLLPIAPLDGKRAWRLVPMLIRRQRARPRDESALEAFERARREALGRGGPA